MKWLVASVNYLKLLARRAAPLKLLIYLLDLEGLTNVLCSGGRGGNLCLLYNFQHTDCNLTCVYLWWGKWDGFDKGWCSWGLNSLCMCVYLAHLWTLILYLKPLNSYNRGNRDPLTALITFNKLQLPGCLVGKPWVIKVVWYCFKDTMQVVPPSNAASHAPEAVTF